MLSGLLFADHEALDRPGQLTATLPFGGGTVIEHQARLLVAAGAAQLVVSAGRLTPELLGALARIGKRGVAVDPVRSAAEAAGKLHPLSTVVMLADGLITTQELVDEFARNKGDALLVVPAEEAEPHYERLGGGMAWAGMARVDPRRVGEVAAMPRDYDLQSTVLRLAEQARADRLPLPAEAVRDGHGIEHAGAALTVRSRTVLAATVADRRDWFNAAVLGPAARAVAPWLIDRHVQTSTVMLGGGAVGLAGAAAVHEGWVATGLATVVLAGLSMGVGRVLASLRDEEGLARAGRVGTLALPALAVLAAMLALGDDPIALLLGTGLLFLGALGERAIRRERRRRWWGGPPAYLLLVAAGAAIGSAVIGIAAATIYAGATVIAAVESLRSEA